MRATSPPNGIEPETWAMFRMIAKVYTLALRDARGGSIEAISFLDTVAPDWRQRVKKKPRHNQKENAQ